MTATLQVADEGLVDDALPALGWTRAVLDPGVVPAIAYAGTRHLILLLASREVLADLDHDNERMRATMAARDLTTVALVQREHATRFHARNLFPPGDAGIEVSGTAADLTP